MRSRCRRRCMRRSWAKSTATASIRWQPRWRWPAWSPSAARAGAEPLTFGMTFPFSTHNYQLRFWMAAGGVDPDEDVRLVVLPPPYMVDSLASGHVDAFCVGAPWNSVAVDLGVGHILHFVSDILVRAAEKVLAVRQDWAEKNPDVLAALIRAHIRAAEFIEQPENRAEAAQNPRAAGTHRRRCRGHPAHARRPPEDLARRHDAREQPLSAGRTGGRGPARSGAGRLALCADGAVGAGAAQPGGAQDRHGRVPAGPLRRGGRPARQAQRALPTPIGAFAGPAFDPADIAGHLAAFRIGRRKA